MESTDRFGTIVLLSFLGLSLAGCCETLLPTCGDTCAEYEWTPETAGTVRGTLSRSSSLELDDGGGEGTLCIGLYNACPASVDDARRVVGLFISNAELTSSDTVVHFEMSPVPPGTYFLRSKLDADDTGCPGSGSKGDVVMLDCEELLVEDQGETEVDGVLDYVIPM